MKKDKLINPKDILHKQAAKFIENITKQLYNYIENIESPEIHTILAELNKKKVTIEWVETILNNHIFDKFPQGIKPKGKGDIVVYRHIAWYILIKMGYTLQEIADYFLATHGTIINARNRIEGLLEVKDVATIKIYYTILEKLK